jgi:hypothetical protein
VERTVAGNIYLDLLEHFVFPQAGDSERENVTGVDLQQDSTVPHFILQVYLALNAGFLNS